jgi:hypothetical protein
MCFVSCRLSIRANSRLGCGFWDDSCESSTGARGHWYSRQLFLYLPLMRVNLENIPETTFCYSSTKRSITYKQRVTSCPSPMESNWKYYAGTERRRHQCQLSYYQFSIRAISEGLCSRYIISRRICTWICTQRTRLLAGWFMGARGGSIFLLYWSILHDARYALNVWHVFLNGQLRSLNFCESMISSLLSKWTTLNRWIFMRNSTVTVKWNDQPEPYFIIFGFIGTQIERCTSVHSTKEWVQKRDARLVHVTRHFADQVSKKFLLESDESKYMTTCSF